MRRDLSTLDRDIGQDWSRILQEAFAHGILNDMIFGGLEPGQTIMQALYAVSTTKICKIGTRRVGADGRVFRYTYAGYALDSSVGCWSSDYQALAQWAEFPTTYAAGVLEISVTAENITDGVAFDGKFAKDVLQGGYIVMFQTGIQATTHLIAGNKVLNAPGELFIQLAHPLRSPITSGAGSAEAIFSPYRDVICVGGSPGNAGRNPIVGIPLCNAVLGEYSWIITWGPVHCATSDAAVGSEAGNHNVAFAGQNGSLVAEDSDADRKLQHAGFVLAQDYNSGSPQQGSPFIMLQISP